MVKIFTFFIFMFSQNLWANPFTPATTFLGKGGYNLSFLGSYWQSTGYYDENGQVIQMGPNDAFSMTEGEVDLRYGKSDKLQFGGGFRFRQLQASFDGANQIVENSNSGLDVVWGSLFYHLGTYDSMSYALKFKFTHAFYANAEYDTTSSLPEDEQVLGDSGNEWELGVDLSYNRSRVHSLNAGMSFRQPGNHLSSEIPFALNSVWQWQFWTLKMGVDGIYSMGTDEFTADPSSKPLQGTRPSMLFNSINRQWADAVIGIEKKFTHWSLGYQLNYRVQGQSTDQGVRHLLMFNYRQQGLDYRTKKINQFKDYDIEASVVRSSPRGKFVLIDKGLSDDVEKGMVFDIYQTDYFGGNILVASGIAHQVRSEETIIRLTRQYQSIKVKKGFQARGH